MNEQASGIPIKVKLPLGFVILFLCVMGIGGYFVINSVYAPLNREIQLRIRSEAVTLATLFDKELESLSRRAEDFSSDGYIRTRAEKLISGDPEILPGTVEDPLIDHLRLNKLSIVQAFIDLHIYDTNKQKILSVADRYGRADHFLSASFHPDEQRFSPILPPDSLHAFPSAAIVTPLYDIAQNRHVGYLACFFDLALVIEHAAFKYDKNIAETGTEKYLTFEDQRGLIMEIPWWRLQTNPGIFPAGGKRAGINIIPPYEPGANAEPEIQNRSDTSEIFSQSYPLESAGWRATIAINTAEALSPLTALEDHFLAIAFVMTIPILGLLFLAIRHVIHPLGELQRMAIRIKEGDFSARNEIDTKDEIGLLAHTSNLMAEAIEERTGKLEQAAEDLKNREHDLRVQHNLLNTVIDAMSDGLILMDFQSHVKLSNKAAEPLLGIIERNNGRVHIQRCEYHRDEPDQCVNCMCDPNQPTSCILTVDETVYEILSTRVSTLYGSSKVLVARNITEREQMRRRQAHQERLAVLGKLSAVVAHEMNNPLAAISMYNQMMAAELSDDSPFQEHVDVIRRNTASCRHIMRSLLDYAGAPQPKMQETDIYTLLNDVVRFIRPLHKKTEVEIESSGRADDLICWGDAMQLQQVFVNLIVNAAQAMDESGGCIRLKTAVTENGDITIDIIDDGPGISEEHQDNIFEPFYTTKSSGGTGLGLPTSRQIVEAHQGELTLVATAQGRTVFRVTLPKIRPRTHEEYIQVTIPPQEALH